MGSISLPALRELGGAQGWTGGCGVPGWVTPTLADITSTCTAEDIAISVVCEVLALSTCLLQFYDRVLFNALEVAAMRASGNLVFAMFPIAVEDCQ